MNLIPVSQVNTWVRARHGTGSSGGYTSLAVWANMALAHQQALLRGLCSCSLGTALQASTALALRTRLIGRAWLLFFGGAWLWLYRHTTVSTVLSEHSSGSSGTAVWASTALVLWGCMALALQTLHSSGPTLQ